MSEKVRVSWAQIIAHLTDERLKASAWTAHCGCSHAADGAFIRCAGHAAGQDVVECERA